AELLDHITRPVTLHADNITLGKALDIVLASTGLQAIPYTENIVTLKAKSSALYIADGIITGVVRNVKTQRPVANATITLDDGGMTVQTDRDGKFRITVKSGDHRISVQAVGIRRVAQMVTVPDGGIVDVDILVE